MTLSEELTWRGFYHQTTYDDITSLDGPPIRFYWGVDPSADSMTVGNLAIAMMIKHFLRAGHHPVLLVGGATGLIGDPDGKARERQLISDDTIAANSVKIAAQYKTIFAGADFEVVNNYDWFSSIGYLEFLRDIGKHVPVRQMIGREFVQRRLGEGGTGISYAEFSYALVQAYDFLHLNREKQVTLQVCGADQWGNSVAGVDLIRRVNGGQAHVWSAPLVVNQASGEKFGKTETGAIWLDPAKTSPTSFYQFWINCDDGDVEDYLKLFTLFDKPQIASIMSEHNENQSARVGQQRLAAAVTEMIHGVDNKSIAEKITDYLTGRSPVSEAGEELVSLRREIPSVQTNAQGSIIQSLVDGGLATSNGDARRLIVSSAVSINGEKVKRDTYQPTDFKNGRLLLRKGKAYKDTVLVELG